MSDERRRFFRITDTVGVAYKVLSEEEIAAQEEGEQSPEKIFNMITNYDAAIEALLVELASKDTLLEELLSAMNKKINSVISHLELESRLIERLAHKIQEVNISACGIAFYVMEELMEGQIVSLDIALYPTETHVFTYGTVVGSDFFAETGERFVRIDFYGMESSDQEVLIQHIVKRQSTMMQVVRQADEQSTH